MPGQGLTSSALQVFRIGSGEWRERGSPPMIGHLRGAAGVVLTGHSTTECEHWAKAVLAARQAWTSDFGAEQFSLGRAFYTHLETGRGDLYFRDAAASDARVERALPGMQASVLALLAALVGGTARRRLGFCGPGVHVFPAGGEVASRGGVVHFDVEGLTPLQLQRGHRAVTLVWMLQAAEWGGGLRIWNALYRDSEHPTEAQLAAPRLTLRYRPGDVLFSDSRRLHQIRPFRGARDRISVTAHAVEVDRDVWELWF